MGMPVIFNKIISNISLLNKFNVIHYARVTLTAKSPDVEEIVNAFKNKGITDVIFSLLTPTDSCTTDLYPINSPSVVADLFSSYKKQNSKKKIDNTSGQTGVVWHKRDKKWQVNIRVSGKKVHLGYFIEFHEAVNARKNSEILYGFHENHGKDK